MSDSLKVRSFPAGLVVSPDEVRVPGDAIASEAIWVPGEDIKDGKFRHWLRLLLHPDGSPRTNALLAAVPVRIQRCIADNRGALDFLTGGHGQPVAFQDTGPVGKGGATRKVDVLTKRPDDGVLLWSDSPGGLDEGTVTSALPVGTDVQRLQNAWLAKGAAEKLLAGWASSATASTTPTPTRAQHEKLQAGDTGLPAEFRAEVRGDVEAFKVELERLTNDACHDIVDTPGINELFRAAKRLRPGFRMPVFRSLDVFSVLVEFWKACSEQIFLSRGFYQAPVMMGPNMPPAFARFDVTGGWKEFPAPIGPTVWMADARSYGVKGAAHSADRFAFIDREKAKTETAERLEWFVHNPTVLSAAVLKMHETDSTLLPIVTLGAMEGEEVQHGFDHGYVELCHVKDPATHAHHVQLNALLAPGEARLRNMLRNYSTHELALASLVRVAGELSAKVISAITLVQQYRSQGRPDLAWLAFLNQAADFDIRRQPVLASLQAKGTMEINDQYGVCGWAALQGIPLSDKSAKGILDHCQSGGDPSAAALALLEASRDESLRTSDQRVQFLHSLA
jgi:hypothetical protein